jgi:hypothetical protein
MSVAFRTRSFRWDSGRRFRLCVPCGLGGAWQLPSMLRESCPLPEATADGTAEAYHGAAEALSRKLLVADHRIRYETRAASFLGTIPCLPYQRRIFRPWAGRVDMPQV